MSGIYNPHERLDLRTCVCLVSPIAGLSSKILIAKVQCPGFSTIHFDQREIIERKHDGVGVSWGRGKRSQVTHTNAVVISNLQDLISHFSTKEDEIGVWY